MKTEVYLPICLVVLLAPAGCGKCDVTTASQQPVPERALQSVESNSPAKADGGEISAETGQPPFPAPTTDSVYASSKAVTELTDSEAEVVRQICADTLKKFFNQDIVAWQETTYYVMPDDEGSASPGSMQRLDSPIKVLSVLGYGFSTKSSTLKSVLADQVGSRVATSEGKRYEILEASVFVEARGGGGATGHPLDKVTIFPMRIRII